MGLMSRMGPMGVIRASALTLFQRGEMGLMADFQRVVERGSLMGLMADDIIKIGCAAGAEPIFDFLLFLVSRGGWLRLRDGRDRGIGCRFRRVGRWRSRMLSVAGPRSAWG